MSDLNVQITCLQEIGLSEYESRCFISLLEEGKSTAPKLAKLADIPSNKIYQVLERLTGKGYVKRLKGKGSVYQFYPTDFNQLFDQLELEFRKKVDLARRQLSMLLERQKRTEFPTTYTITGRNELNATLRQILTSTSTNLLISLDTLVEIELSKSIGLLKDLYSQGVNIKVLTSPEGINDSYEINIYKELKFLEFRITEHRLTNILVIVDTTYSVQVTYTSVKETQEEKEFVGLYSEDSGMAKMLSETFKLYWERSKSIDQFL